MPRFAPFLLSLSCLLPTPLLAQEEKPAAYPPAGDRLLVCNKAAHTLSIFSPLERRELATLPTGQGPHEVAISPDGAMAVVTDYGAQKPGQTLTVIDLTLAAVVRTIDLTMDEVQTDGTRSAKTFLRPHGVQFVAPHRVVVTSEASRRLLLVDVELGKIERTWTSPQTTMHMVSLSADRTRAAATSIREGSVVFFNLAADGTASTPPIECAPGSEGLAIDPTTGFTWVGNRAANTLSVVDASTAKVLKTIATGDFPFRLTFPTDGKHALVTCAEGGQLQVFDTKTYELVREISIHADASELSAMPMGVTTDPDGKRAYVACGRGEFVSVIDLEAGKVIDRLPAGKGCDGIAYARPVVAAPAAAVPARLKG